MHLSNILSCNKLYRISYVKQIYLNVYSCIYVLTFSLKCLFVSISSYCCTFFPPLNHPEMGGFALKNVQCIDYKRFGLSHIWIGCVFQVKIALIYHFLYKGFQIVVSVDINLFVIFQFQVCGCF